MRLLHVSDIHFTFPQCTGEMDADLVYRSHLIEHARQRSEDIGDIDGVLFTGDIAFCGRKEEFDAAKIWLAKLCDAIGCDPSQVFVVPGNHDVDRRAYSTGVSVKNTADAIARAESLVAREKLLQQILEDKVAGAFLLQPIDAYNEFAASYGCNITPKKPFWTQKLELAEGVCVELRGMTSTLLSGREVPEHRRDLHLGVFQAQLSPSRGTLHLAMAHHPIGWMSDAEEVRNRLEGEPALLLFGHEHKQGVNHNVGNALTVCAGAVNPDRRELGWRPGYNLLEFEVIGQDVKARIHQFKWDYEPNGFNRKLGRDGEEYIDHTFIDVGECSVKSAPTLGSSRETVDDAEAESEQKPVSWELVMTQLQAKQLIYKFWKLRRSRRKSVMVAMGLLEIDTPVVNEPDVYYNFIITLANNDRLDEFERAINAQN